MRTQRARLHNLGCQLPHGLGLGVNVLIDLRLRDLCVRNLRVVRLALIDTSVMRIMMPARVSL